MSYFLDGSEILKGLGVTANVPSLGYVFKKSWADAHKPALTHFLKAARLAKQQICTKDSVWQTVVPLTHVSDEKTLELLRQRYCQGGLEQWGTDEQQAAETIYQLLRGVSQNQLTGTAEHVSSGTFWTLD